MVSLAHEEQVEESREKEWEGEQTITISEDNRGIEGGKTRRRRPAELLGLAGVSLRQLESSERRRAAAAAAAEANNAV